MKNLLKIFILLVFFLNIFAVNAEINLEKTKKTITESFTEEIKKEDRLTIEESFIFFSKFFESKTPKSYEYIKSDFKGIKLGSDFEKALKILIYNNKIPNLKADFKGLEKSEIKTEIFYNLAGKILGINYSKETIQNLKESIGFYDLEIVEESYKISKTQKEFEESLKINSGNRSIFDEVYNIIINEYLNKEKIDRNKIIESAIEGMLKGLNDTHTVYFPPTKSKEFLGGLSGDFEGIGTYVEMPEPGVFMITSPIPNGPADKVGIKGGDIILEVDSNIITKDNSAAEIISWIKGEAGTEVELKVKRNEYVFNVKVVREKVHLKSILAEENGNSFVIKITGFNQGITSELQEAIETLKGKTSIKKIVFDLRNNGGGYLDEVVSILSFFIPKAEPIAIVKYTEAEGKYLSKGYNLLDLNNYEIVFIQNGGTASASEIMIGTIKDYFDVKIVGEKSYGKGSVQSIKEFYDGSSIKYTTAKWFTGKTSTGIEGIGINPTYELKFDENLFKNSKIDNQLQKALSI